MDDSRLDSAAVPVFSPPSEGFGASGSYPVGAPGQATLTGSITEEPFTAMPGDGASQCGIPLTITVDVSEMNAPTKLSGAVSE